MIYECNGSFFADEVDRAFGDNLVVPVVGLVTVYPANDYVRQHGRNLTTLALDGLCRVCGIALRESDIESGECVEHQYARQ